MFDKKYLPVYLLLGFFLLINLFALSDYGMTWDEAAQQHIGKANIDYILQKTDNIELLREDAIYYGPFFEIINIFFSKIFLALGFEYVSAFHLLTLLVAFIGLFFLFLFIKKMFNEGIAFYSLIFLIFIPRFMAHAHYNSKDIPITAFSIIALYFLYLTFKKREFSYPIWAGIFLGLAVSVRVSALLVLLIFIIPCLINWALKFKEQVKYIKKDLILSLVFFISSAITVFVTWPALWKNPLLFFQSISYFLHHGWIGEVLYLGQIYPGSQIPWHYPLVYLSITIPVITLLFFLVGLFISLSKILKKDNLPAGKAGVLEYGIIIFWFLIPLAMAMKSGIVKYDGIRHYLISLPALATLAGLGLYYLIKKINKDFIIILLLIIGGLLIYDSIVIYPHGGSYFNQALRIAIPNNIEQHFEIEYWGASYRQGFEWMNQRAKPNSIICLPFADHLVQFYPIRTDLIYSCTPESNYLMFFTRKTYMPKDIDEYFNYSSKDPVFTITRYKSNLLEAYEIK